ncbi:hypothetical protein [Streptomyces sp. NPDC058695]|uniref:hypothetical protein n=1 Tax=Streptomyces sp. NPDC058695 TaxID=3346604 RepID=UPI00364B742F
MSGVAGAEFGEVGVSLVAGAGRRDAEAGPEGEDGDGDRDPQGGGIAACRGAGGVRGDDADTEVMTDLLGPVFGPGECAMTAGVASATRGRLLSLPASAPLLVLTQTAQHGGRPAYLAKYIVRAGERLSINQPPQS